MDDGSQKLLDVIDDPTALESFLGLSAATAAAAAAAAASAAGEIVSVSSSRTTTATTTTTTLESLVDSLQQGLLDPTGASRGAPSGGINPSTGSLVLTQQQLQQLQHFQQQQQQQQQQQHHHHHHQVGQGRGVSSSHQQNPNQATAVTFTLPPHSNPATNVGSSASGTVVTSSSSPCVTSHHFVLTPFQQTTSQPPTSFIYTPASSASAPICTTATGLPSIAINHTGGAILAANPNSSQSSVSMAPSASNLFIPAGAAAAQGSNPGGVLVGPSGTAVFAPASAAAVASPDSPFSVPTRSPAPHAPPTPSPSPLPLRSPASVPSHHPPSPAPSPYHTQLQSPQQQQSSSSSNYTAQHYVTANSQPAGPGSSFVLSSSQSSNNFKDAFSIQQQQQPSVVVMPTQQQQRPQQSQTQSSSSSNPSPVQSPYSQHLMQHLNNGTGGSQPTRSPQQQTPGGALTPAPSPSPQTRTAASPVIRSTTPQPPTVIHQAITAGLALSGTGQFPVMPPGSAAMLQGNHQLVQIIHHQAAVPQTNTFPAHTQIITTAGHGGGMPVQQPGSTKPKQPPQILPKPPSGQPATPGHSKIPSSARTSVSTQHQNLHTQHQATTPAAQVVIGQANPTAVIPTAQSGTLLLNQVIPGLGPGGPLLVQQNPGGGVQLILRPPTPSTQPPQGPSPATANHVQGGQQGQPMQQQAQQQQHQAGKSPTPQQAPMFISSSAAAAQLVHNAGRQQTQQVLRLITAQGPMQLQQIQTPAGPTLIAVPSGQTLSFQQLGPTPPSLPPPPQATAPTPPTAAPATAAQPQQRPPTPHQPSQSIIPAMQLPTAARPQTLNISVPNSGIGPHSISVGTANSATPVHTPIIQHNNHQVHAQAPQQQTQSTQQQHQMTNTGMSPRQQPTVHDGVTNTQCFPMVQRNNVSGTVLQHHCMTTTDPSLNQQKKKPKKKKKKKKKEEETKLDLANIMKLSGIGDDEDMSMYDTDEATLPVPPSQTQSQQQSPSSQQSSQQHTPQSISQPSSQSPAPGQLEVGTQSSPTASQPSNTQQQSQLIAQLRSPPQHIPLQGASGAAGSASLRLALEDGRVIFHPSDSQAANIILHNIATATTATSSASVQASPSVLTSNQQQQQQQQQQHGLAATQNQLSALLAAGGNAAASNGNNNHVVLSHLLQQSTQSGLPPHLISTGTNTPNTRTASSLPPSPSPTPHASIGTNMPPQSDTRFATLQGKTGYGPPDGTKLEGGMIGLQASKNCNHGFKVEGSMNTAMHNKTSPAGVMVDGHGGAHLLVQQAKSPVQHTCGHHLITETKEVKHNSATTQTTQTEILHHTQGTLQLGQNSSKPSEQFLTSKSVSTEAAGSAFLGLHSFQNLQGLVSTAGGSIPLMTASVATSTCGSSLGASGEQLLIAHHGGMSVLATPQLIQQLTQGAQAAGIVNMPQLQLASNALNKMQGLAFNPQTGTIVIGGNEAIAFNNQHKPTAVALNSTTVTAAAAAAKVVSSSTQQPSVVVQQVNTSTTVGSPSTPVVRRCSSDSNSSISIGSPSSGTSGTTVIGLINPSSALPPARKQTQQSIETQTISLGIPPTSNATQNVQNTILETIAHAHPNLVLNKLVASPQQAPHLLANANTVMGPKKKKLPKQTRNMTNKILPIVTATNLPTPVNRICNSSVSTGTDSSKVEQQRNLMKPNTVCQGTQHVLRHTTPNYMPATSFPQQQQPQPQHVSAMPPLTSICSVNQSTTSTLCQAGSNTAPTVVTSALPTSVVSKVISGSCTSETAMQHVTVTTRTVAVGHHCAASQTQAPQQMHQGGVAVPHLVPIPPGGSNSSSGSGPTVYQKVQTIQLTPQNQKHLKAVQMQIQSLTARKTLTSIDQAALQRLYEEQQRILLTGKVVPTIPGQHAVGLPISNSDVLEGKQKTSMEVQNNATNTYLANLLRQQSTIPSPHQNCPVAQESVAQVSVRYQHQVGNQVIPLAPPQQQQKQVLLTPTVTSSSVVTTTVAAPITTRASISVQCGTTSPDPNKLMSAPCIKQVPPSCEKGTSPLQVQVGTQTGLPCLDSPHAKISPIAVSSKLSPGQQQQVYCSPSKVQPMFATSSVAAKAQPMPGSLGVVKASSASTGSQTTPQTLLPSGCKMTVVAPVSPTDRATTPIVTLAAAVPNHQPAATPLCATSVTTSAAVSSALPIHTSITTSPVRPTISRGDLIEQQLKTDQNGACMPDTQTPFQSTSDACKRLIRYHVFNEQVLSQQDLEKADEIFEATARHLLDKFRQMMNKYRYLLLMESMREVNTSELMMIDRMFVAEEHTLLEKLREEERQVKEEPLVPTEGVPTSATPPLQTIEVKMEPVESPERLKEVRIMVQDVMKDNNLKRELEEDMKVTVGRPTSGEYDEWEEIQKELAVYSPSAATVKSEPQSEPDTGDPPESSSPPGVHSQSGPCGPRDEGGGSVSSGIASGEKRKDICDNSAVIHRKKRHKTGSSSPLSEEDDINAQVQCAIDSILNLQRSEDGFDLHSTQAGNGQGVVNPSTEMGVPMDEGPDGEDTRAFVDESRSIVKQCSGAVEQIVRTRHKRNSASSKTSDHLVMNSFHHNYSSGSGERTIEGSGGDSALDEAVRSILTS